MKWLDRLADWFDELPVWANILLFPIIWPFNLAYVIFGTPRNRVANFSLAEVYEHAELLSRWFDETLAKDPTLVDCLGVGPSLARKRLCLVLQPELNQEEASDFARRVQQELKGYKGSPFAAICILSDRLAELADIQRAA